MKFSDLRRDFGKYDLDESKLPADPVLLMEEWLEEVKSARIHEFNAMVLSTVGKQGQPSSRIVLLKEITRSGGVVFYSNYLSRKGRELHKNPLASLLFFWPSVERQLRIEGRISKVSTKKSDAYFYSRPFESRLSAIVSPQSQTILSLGELEKEGAELRKCPGKLKRPENWGGYEMKPDVFEFWQGGKHRLHNRICYKQMKNHWVKQRLAP